MSRGVPAVHGSSRFAQVFAKIHGSCNTMFSDGFDGLCKMGPGELGAVVAADFTTDNTAVSKPLVAVSREGEGGRHAPMVEARVHHGQDRRVQGGQVHL